MSLFNEFGRVIETIPKNIHNLRFDNTYYSHFDFRLLSETTMFKTRVKCGEKIKCEDLAIEFKNDNFFKFKSQSLFEWAESGDKRDIRIINYYEPRRYIKHYLLKNTTIKILDNRLFTNTGDDTIRCVLSMEEFEVVRDWSEFDIPEPKYVVRTNIIESDKTHITIKIKTIVPINYIDFEVTLDNTLQTPVI